MNYIMAGSEQVLGRGVKPEACYVRVRREGCLSFKEMAKWYTTSVSDLFEIKKLG